MQVKTTLAIARERKEMMPIPQGEAAFFGKDYGAGGETAGTDEHAMRSGQLSRQRAV